MNWQQKLESCRDNIDRAMLARSADCDARLLRIFCLEDLDPMVVGEAAANANTDIEYASAALRRYPSLDNVQFWDKRNNNLRLALKDIEAQGKSAVSGDRDQIILDHILEQDGVSHADSHLGEDSTPTINGYIDPGVQWADTDKYRVAMIVPPAWGIVFPPYNMAKLSAIMRKYGYGVKVYDSNVESYHYLLNITHNDYWRGERYFLWTVKENFQRHILPYIKPLLDATIDEIVAANPRVIGFSLYNTNMNAAEYMMERLKRLLPDACYLAGGPEVATNSGDPKRFGGSLRLLGFNYLFVGEAEETLISTLENLPEVLPDTEIVGSTDSKIVLDEHPYPDYSDYVLSNYQHRDGVSIETSRGCVAQCSFCAETNFWKFRSTGPERVVDEMEYQVKTHGVRRFWFVDSLVNGNLKNFTRLIELIIERKLNIGWNSYARCDGRMSRDFLAKVWESGCSCISYGVESGSQRVLTDMRKKVDLWEIENNLKDSQAVGLFTHVNWIVGFPTEAPIDFLHSCQLLANCRRDISVISVGFGAGPAFGSHMTTDWRIYGIVGKHSVGDQSFLGTWYTDDYQNTVLHRFIRIKMTHVWLEIMAERDSIIINSQRLGNVGDFYTFETDSQPRDSVVNDEYVNFTRLGTDFKGTIANEYLAIAYGLFLYFGRGRYTMTSNPEMDFGTFGDALAQKYTSKFTVEFTDDGEYTLSLNHWFEHVAISAPLADIYARERDIKDMSFTDTFVESGNFNSWREAVRQTGETVHQAYRGKGKIIPIQSS